MIKNGSTEKRAFSYLQKGLKIDEIRFSKELISTTFASTFPRGVTIQIDKHLVVEKHLKKLFSLGKIC